MRKEVRIALPPRLDGNVTMALASGSGISSTVEERAHQVAIEI